MYVQVYVVVGVNEDLLLGRDYLGEYKVEMSFHSGTIMIKRNEKEIIVHMIKAKDKNVAECNNVLMTSLSVND